MDIEKVSSVIKTTVEVVGQRLRTEYLNRTKIKIDDKGNNDFVTELDHWSEEQFKIALEQNFPEHVLVGEESVGDLLEKEDKSLEEIINQNICWVVDPIDGTNNFTNYLPHFCVSVGVVDKGERVLGFVYDPSAEELFFAEKGKGAFLNGKEIRVSGSPDLHSSIVTVAYPLTHERWDIYRPSYEVLIRDARAVRQLGAAALDICWLAAARIDAFSSFYLKPWDLAAASLIAEEAGAVIGNEGEEEFSMFKERFIFANKNSYAEFRDVCLK